MRDVTCWSLFHVIFHGDYHGIIFALQSSHQKPDVRIRMMAVKSGCSSTIRTGMVTSWELQRQRPRSPYCHGCASPIGQHKLCSILIGRHRTGWSAANVFHITYETGLTSFKCCINWQNIWICPGSSSEPPKSRSQRVFQKRRTSSIDCHSMKQWFYAFLFGTYPEQSLFEAFWLSSVNLLI